MPCEPSAWSFLELELQEVVKLHEVPAKKSTGVSWKSSKCFQPLSHLSSSVLLYFPYFLALDD